MARKSVVRWIVTTEADGAASSLTAHYWATARILYETAVDNILGKGTGGRVLVAYHNEAGVEQPVIETTLHPNSTG